MTEERTTTFDMLGEAAHRQLGMDLFNHTWTLIRKVDRTQAEDDDMVSAAHAAALHWSRGGATLANAARSQWQIARVYSTLGRAEPALWHARRSLELAQAATESGVAEDWDVPAALEGLARAHAVAGDRVASLELRARARAALDGIADPDHRAVIEQDLETTPV